MNRGINSPIGGFAPQSSRLFAAMMGGGAAADGTVAGNGQLTDANGLYPKGVNFASSLTYNSATGVYYVTLTEAIKHITFASGIVVDSGSAPTTALVCVVSKIISTSKRIDVRIYTPAGVLTDLGTSDMLILAIDAADTTAIG
jgi:hypothetical protein